MAVDLQLLKSFCSGVAEITGKEGLTVLHRFTPEERAVYTGHPDFGRKIYATSGVKLEFLTDAKSFLLEGSFVTGSSRCFAGVDISVNGILTEHFCCENIFDDPEVSLEVKLDGRLNTVSICFPCVSGLMLKDFAVEDFTELQPPRRRKQMICYGDSITQGYDTRYPSMNYSHQLAAMLDMQLINKAVAGEVFNPALTAAAASGKPDLLTIAYGTNDWKQRTPAETMAAADEFFENLFCRYPETPALVILPIWRKDLNETAPGGDFEVFRNGLRRVAEKFPQVRIIDGWPLVPHIAEFFSDGFLHPNDTGFAVMGKNLLEAIRKIRI
ncbi:MAG: SGNH/GDSL hydrolase family protein [Lentisphaeria bacterium]|nr:SGNH/GDSL hydrolase family protein [Lentisphaeria bacterium]